MRENRLLMILWIAFLLLMLAFGAWLIYQAAQVPVALRHTVWESGRLLPCPPVA